VFGYLFVLSVTVLFYNNNISWGLNATLRKTEILISSKIKGDITIVSNGSCQHGVAHPQVSGGGDGS